MKGQIAFEAMTNMQDHLIIEAAGALGYMGGRTTGRPRREKGESALSRFLNSGLGVAMICALVSLSVLAFIIWAGNRTPVVDPPVGSDTATEAETETDGITPPDTAKETESESDTQRDTETESDTEPQTQPETETDNGYTGEPQTDVRVEIGDRCLYPQRYFVHSTGTGNNDESFGLGCDIREAILPAITLHVDSPQDRPILTIPAHHQVDGASVFTREGEHLREANILDNWSLGDFVDTLPLGEYHISIRTIYREDNGAYRTDEYVFWLLVERETPLCADGHTWGDTPLEIPANCYEGGQIILVCSECGHRNETGTQKLNHVYEDGFCTLCGLVQGADSRFVMDLLIGMREAIVMRYDGGTAEGRVILPNVYYDMDTRSMVPVTYLNHSLLAGQTGLSEVILPDTLTYIGQEAFSGCTSLTGIALPDTLREIDSNAFSGCRALAELRLPEGLTAIHDGAFNNCRSLERVVIPDSVETMRSGVFQECTALTEAVLPAGLTHLSSSLFWGCTSLSRVSLPERLTSVGDGVFQYCASLAEISLPDTVVSMGYHVFHGCTSLEHFTVPPLMTELSAGCFAGCTSLTRVELSDSLTRITGDFTDCVSLESVHLPASVVQLDDNIWSMCSDLTIITVDLANPVYTASGNCLIHKESKTLIAGGKNAVIPSDGSVLAIGNWAFSGRNITHIEIPAPVERIGYYAFLDSALETVTLPNTLTDMDAGVFTACTALKSVILPDSLRNVNVGLFRGCTALETLFIPASVAGLDTSSFDGCTSLSLVTYGGTVAMWQEIASTFIYYPGDVVPDFTVSCTDGSLMQTKP